MARLHHAHIITVTASNKPINGSQLVEACGTKRLDVICCSLIFPEGEAANQAQFTPSLDILVISIQGN